MIRGKNPLLVFSVLSILFGSLAVAADARSDDALEGSFSFTATQTCTQSVGGFSPPPSLLSGGFGAAVIYDAWNGTIEFDGKGNATESGHGMTVFDGPIFPNNPAAGTFTSNCKSTYSMTGQLSFTMTGLCSGTIPDGPAAGQTYMVTGGQLDGQISRDGNMILLSSVDPVQSTIVLSGGFNAQRFCIGTRTLIRGTNAH